MASTAPYEAFIASLEPAQRVAYEELAAAQQLYTNVKSRGNYDNGGLYETQSEEIEAYRQAELAKVTVLTAKLDGMLSKNQKGLYSDAIGWARSQDASRNKATTVQLVKVVAVFGLAAGAAAIATSGTIAGGSGAATLIGSEGADVALTGTTAVGGTAATGGVAAHAGIGASIIAGAKAVAGFIKEAAPYAGLISAGVGIAQGVSQIIGEKQHAEDLKAANLAQTLATEKDIATNTKLATDNYVRQLPQVDRRVLEDDQASRQEEALNAARGTAARSTGSAAAAEAGVGGNSVSALFQEFSFTEGEFNAALRVNRQRSYQAARDEKEALRLQALGHIAAIRPYVPQPVDRPDYIGATLRIGGSVFDSAFRYYGYGVKK